jgi:hypothetical protein
VFNRVVNVKLGQEQGSRKITNETPKMGYSAIQMPE